jgi:cytochrome c biogenesis protein CcmG/thiol:disulfide interchange protein DsbE
MTEGSAKGVDGAGVTRASTGSVLLVGTGGVPKGVEPAKSTTRDRARPPDRTFQVIAVLGGLCLIGFIVFVAVRAPAKSTRTLGVASLKAPPPAVLHAGSSAPAFSLPRLGGGAPVTLSSFLGTPVIVNFFASWCPDCRSELAAMGTVAARNSGRVAVVGIDSNDGTGTPAQQLLVAAHATYPVGVDTSAQVAAKYLLVALPVTYFLDAHGRVVGSALGAQTVTSLQRWVNRLFPPAS